MPLKYVIITSSDISSLDFTKIEENSEETLRWNIDNTKTFVKFKTSNGTPIFLNDKTLYTYEQILVILNDVDGEWFVEDTSLA